MGKFILGFILGYIISFIVLEKLESENKKIEDDKHQNYKWQNTLNY